MLFAKKLDAPMLPKNKIFGSLAVFIVEEKIHGFPHPSREGVGFVGLYVREL
jgi:hypothetical protein